LATWSDNLKLADMLVSDAATLRHVFSWPSMSSGYGQENRRNIPQRHKWRNMGISYAIACGLFGQV